MIISWDFLPEFKMLLSYLMVLFTAHPVSKFSHRALAYIDLHAICELMLQTPSNGERTFGKEVEMQYFENFGAEQWWCFFRFPPFLSQKGHRLESQFHPAQLLVHKHWIRFLRLLVKNRRVACPDISKNICWHIVNSSLFRMLFFQPRVFFFYAKTQNSMSRSVILETNSPDTLLLEASWTQFVLRYQNKWSTDSYDCISCKSKNSSC